MKVLILADTPNWIVDRITDVMIQRMPFDFTKRYYEQLSGPELVGLGNAHDLVHCQNVIVPNSIPFLKFLEKPFLMSVRSHRYNREHVAAAKPFCKGIHVVNPYQLDELPDAHYIPDGIFDQFLTKRAFVVGFAGHDDEYKGYPLIKLACEAAGVEFRPATNLRPDQMLDYYKSIDLYVCASIAEGHSTPVMECLAMNIPVITTDVGIPRGLDVHKVERDVASIRRGIERYYSWSQVKEYSWENVCKKFVDLYEALV